MGWLAAGALIGGGSSLLGGLLGMGAANNAADAQALAARNAGELAYGYGNQALGLEQNAQNANLGLLQPYLQAGTGAAVNLANMLGVLPSDQLAQQGYNATQATLHPQQTAGPRYGSNVYKDGHGTWQYVGSDGGNDVYNRTDGGQAWLTLGPGGRQSGAGAYPNAGNLTKPGQAMPSGTAGSQPGNGGTVGQSGTSQPALSSYVNPQLGGSGSLMAPFQAQFQAPTNVTEQNDPGYQFRLEQGLKALQNSAAARGGLLSGGTAKALNDYAQNSASNEYGNVYNRALQQYLLPQQNALQQYGMLSGQAGSGQSATNTLSGLTSNAANNSAGILGNMANAMGQQQNNAAAARASGYVGGANAFGGALGQAGGDIGGYLMLRSILNQNQQQPTNQNPALYG